MSFISSFIKSFIRELDKEFPDMEIDVDTWDKLYPEEESYFWDNPLIEPSVFLDENTEIFIQDNIDDTCSICMESYKEKKEQISLPCKHIYHKDCVMTWLKNNNTCPYCRLQLKIIINK
jgi:hypothetical protein